MEDTSLHPMLSNNETAGIVRVLRDVPPAHYILKIESFSLLAATQVEKYESGDFEASGYKWRLSLYPNGNRKRNGNDHISLYLTMSATNNLPLGWEIDVNFKMFAFDQIRDKYLTIQDADGRLRHLHGMMTECGFAQLLSLKTFKDPSNGYLLVDCCVLGVEFNLFSLTADHWFDTSGFGWGFPKFLTLSDLHNTSKGFLVDDMLILEGQLDIISVAKSFS
ncbi:hypothetical protein L1049_012669 [Liquidambar formosana]|uniref:MATH domain-containing protein n=1 Tax=Liquidambar formosana TaxID=63359 RepID=A0AAP0R3B2_LIQFO